MLPTIKGIFLSHTENWQLVLLQQSPSTFRVFFCFFLPRPIYTIGLYFNVSNKRVEWACSLSLGGWGGGWVCSCSVNLGLSTAGLGFKREAGRANESVTYYLIKPTTGEQQELLQIYEQRTLRAAVNRRVLGPNLMLQRDEAGLTPSPGFFSWMVLILARRQFLPSTPMPARHWESNLRVLPSPSHTHLDGKCVLAEWQELVTEIWSAAEGGKKRRRNFARSQTELQKKNKMRQIVIINFYSEYNLFAHE